MYVKLIDGKIEEAPINKDGICNYNLDIERMIADGYKLFVPAEIPQTNRMYHFEYVENDNHITEVVVYDETQEEADLRELQEAKNNKIAQNDIERDATLNKGVTYQDVLFDSDTDQKVNLMYMADKMQPGDKVNWFGMDNQPLECTKEDLTNIGDLITQLHSFCWNKNAEIKALIAAAQTIEEVNEIDIHYILPLETESEETNED